MRKTFASIMVAAFSAMAMQAAKFREETEKNFWNGRRPNRAFRRRRINSGKPWPTGKPRPGERVLYRHQNRYSHLLTHYVTTKHGSKT